MSSLDTAVAVYNAVCCRVWTFTVGVTPRACGICGQVPVSIPGTARAVTVPHRPPMTTDYSAFANERNEVL